MKRYGLSVIAAVVLSVTSVQGQQLAFPGAEGYGRFAQGDVGVKFCL